MYQLDPDFQVGHDVPHEEPLTVPETVRMLPRDSDALIEELVEVLARRFTLEHAGAIASDAAAIGATPRSVSIDAVSSAVIH
ncbi:MAG: hypothetical protein EPO00_11795 [Chloroflexota bacterium]|nr:MAG: hypothetical protein EPO00_11795 [Chloroflexota bacterium]